MTDEEINAICELKNYITRRKTTYTRLDRHDKAIDIILNLIQKQEKEIENKDKTIDEIINTIVCDKKILALFCKHIIRKTDNECDKQNLLCDDCIKQYFERKVKNNA